MDFTIKHTNVVAYNLAKLAASMTYPLVLELRATCIVDAINNYMR
jgi:hypothetical protein